MLIKIPVKKGKAKTYTMECKPIEKRSNPLLDDVFPDTKSLSTLPFATAEFMLHISDRQFMPGEVALASPPLPFAKSTTYKTRFEIRNDRGTRMLTSLKYPFTQQFLYNEALNALDPSIIAERKSIYLGISELVGSIEGDPDEGDPDESDHDEDEEDTRSDKDIATAYLTYFLRQHVAFYKGSKLTSEQVALAIEGFAPEYVRTDLIDRKQITFAVRECFHAGMEKSSSRIDGRHQKFWLDLAIVLDSPQPPRPPRRQSP